MMILLAIEVLYLISFIIIVLLAIIAGAAIVAGSTVTSDSISMTGSSRLLTTATIDANIQGLESPDDINAAMYIAIFMVVFYYPRLYYFGVLSGWNCCGGKTKDTAADRHKLVLGMNALAISHIGSLLSTLIITLALGASFAMASPHIINYGVVLGFTMWWRSDLI